MSPCQRVTCRSRSTAVARTGVPAAHGGVDPRRAVRQSWELPQEFTSTGRFGTSTSAHRILGLEQVPRVGIARFTTRLSALDALHLAVAAAEALRFATADRVLGTHRVNAADGIHRVVNTRMAEGIRLVSVRRGVDPRRFAVLAFGRAAGLHITDAAPGFFDVRVRPD